MDGDKIRTRKTQVDGMGISYPHSTGITFSLILRLSVVWKTHPPEMCTTACQLFSSMDSVENVFTAFMENAGATMRNLLVPTRRT
jgi:hypothetical protein